jgi:hypothetical protein
MSAIIEAINKVIKTRLMRAIPRNSSACLPVATRSNTFPKIHRRGLNALFPPAYQTPTVQEQNSHNRDRLMDRNRSRRLCTRKKRFEFTFFSVLNSDLQAWHGAFLVLPETFIYSIPPYKRWGSVAELTCQSQGSTHYGIRCSHKIYRPSPTEDVTEKDRPPRGL